MEIRLDKHMTIQEVMEKLRRHCGSGTRPAQSSAKKLERLSHSCVQG